jgi:hypothetical protein
MLPAEKAGIGHDSYLPEITPKKVAICGRVWVDTEDLVIARVEGQPATNSGCRR